MKRIAHIKDGSITNISLSDDDAELKPGTMLEADAIAQGFGYLQKIEPIEIPAITARQLRLWLFSQNILSTVEQMITDIGGAAKIEWEYATEYNRTHPMVIQLGTALGMTSEQLDQVFITAATI